MASRKELDPLIIKEWLKRSADKRMERDISLFYAHLKNNLPDLLSFRANGDKYQVLKIILRDHVIR